MNQQSRIGKLKKIKLLKNHIPIMEMYLIKNRQAKASERKAIINVLIIPEPGTLNDSFQLLAWKFRNLIDENIEPLLTDIKNDQEGLISDAENNGIKIC